MTVLGRRALNRALLERQLLLRRERRSPLGVVEHLVGLQAQEPQAPYVGLWSRVAGFDPEEVSAAFETREVVRLTLMRGTLHLVTADDCARLRPPLARDLRARAWSSVGRGLTGVDPDELAAAGAEVLSGGPLGSLAAGRLLAERWPAADPQALGIAMAACVAAVQPPPRGQWRRTGRAVLTPAESWLGRPLDGAPEPDDVVRRYLAAFGPATPADARMWSGLTGLRDAIDRLRPELVVFEDERGRELLDVPGSPLPDPETPAPVRFLPPFDNAVLAHDDRSRILDAEQQRLVVGGAAFVLVDGFARGTWRAERDGAAAVVRVSTSAPLTAAEAEDVEREGLDLLRFLAPEAPRHAVQLV